MFCEKCNSPLEPNTFFCEVCGQRISSTVEPPVAVAPPTVVEPPVVVAPPVAAAPQAQVAPPQIPQPPQPPIAATTPPPVPWQPPKKKKSKKGIVILVIILCVLLLFGGTVTVLHISGYIDVSEIFTSVTEFLGIESSDDTDDGSGEDSENADKDTAKTSPSPSSSTSPSPSGSPSPSSSGSPNPSSAPAAAKKINVSDIDNIITDAKLKATTSYTIKDLKDGQVYKSSNADSMTSASALMNIPIIFTVADELKNNNLKLSDMVTFRYSFNGRGIITKDKDGKSITVEDLMINMLKYSDNNATNSLLAHIGISKVNATCKKHGFSSVDIQRPIVAEATTKDNFVSASDLVGMLDMLYADKFPLGKMFLSRNFKIDDKTGSNGIVKGTAGSGYTVLNHNGLTSDKYNEIAIVSSGTSEYIITVLSVGGDPTAAANLAANIAGFVKKNL